jgi:hypothetical protein
MPAVDDIRAVSVDFARTIATELRLSADRAFEIEVYGLNSVRRPHVRAVTQCGEDLIERYVRRAIEADRKQRSAS